MKIWKKILFLVVTLAALICVLITAAVASEPAAEPSLRIKSFNLSLENAVYMNFKVDATNVTDPKSIKLLAWESAPAAYEKGTEDLCLSVSYIEASTGYAVFQYDDLDAKEMTKMVYVCAYVEQDGVKTYSDSAKFSVAMYAYLKRNATNPNSALVALMDQMLAYGAMAQEYFQYNTDYLANATLYQIDVVNGKLEDGFAKGWYQRGASFTLTANEPAEGYVFSQWVNKDGKYVSEDPILTLEAYWVETYTAVYRSICSEGLEYRENADGTYTVMGIGTCADTELRIPPTHNGKAVTAIGEFAFQKNKTLTSVFIPNSILSIGQGAFDQCTGLTAVHITDLEAWCKIVFPNSYPGSNPLWCAHNLYLNGELVTDLVIPQGITRISNYAFAGCTSIESVEIPEGVTSIGIYAFVKCTSLKSVEIPSTVTMIDLGAFQYCNALTGVYISDLAAWCRLSFSNELGSNPLYYAKDLYLNGQLVVDLVIPEGVEALGDFLFDSCTVQSVYIPASVKNIGIATFTNCSNLKSVVFASNSQLTSLGGGMFYACTSLNEITIPPTVTVIGEDAFYNCTSLERIVIPDAVTTIGSYAFSGCSMLSEVVIGENSRLASIGSYAFKSVYRMKSIVLPNSVAFVGDSAFYLCTGLETVYYGGTAESWEGINIVGTKNTVLTSATIYYYSEAKPDVVNHYWRYIDGVPTVWDSIYSEGLKYTETGVGTYVVSGIGTCTDTELRIPPTHNGGAVVTIDYNAFRNCTNLTSVAIPNSVTSIDSGAFNGCSSLVSITIPDSVTNIGSYAFYYCNSLESIKIPDGVTSIGSYAFSHCSSLTSITIPNSVTSISNSAFYDCGLTSITIPDSVTSIGDEAFANCGSLISITIPDSVTSIGKSAFEGCYKLVEVYNLSSLNITEGSVSNGYVGYYALNVYTSTSVSSKLWTDENGYIFYEDGNICYLIGYMGTETVLTLPVSCRGKDYAISQYAFYVCKELTSVTIGNSVTSIGDWAFHGCKELTSVTIGNSVTSIGDYAFWGCRGLTSITIPDSVTSIGIAAFRGCVKLTSVTIGNSVTSIGNYVFDNCLGLTSITIPDSVTSIGDEMFRSCSSLTSITIPDSVTSIGNSAFYNCDGLTSITIPDSVTSIGNSAFYNCDGLTSITIPDSVTSISNSAFYDCDGLTSITIPDSVTNIGDSAFCECNGLTSITIGNSVTNIGDSAFYQCTGLTSITIGNSVMSIGYSAFQYCYRLTSVYYGGTASDWGKICIGRYCDALISAIRYYYSETQPTTEGNYWHYVDGVPTKW